jgi:hypothetical protein
MNQLLQRPWAVATANPPVRDQIPLDGLDHGTVLRRIRERLNALPDPSQTNTPSISDPTIALADAWAVASEVLAFYQERLNNESYIGTALEDRSVLELARMVGYQRDQGLAATCYLYYTIDQSVLSDVRIPAGRKVRSVPQPGEEPQVFETCRDLTARASWNAISVATGEPGVVSPSSDKIYLAGSDSNLKPGDLLVAILDWREIYFLVDQVEIDRKTDQTVSAVVLRYGPAGAPDAPEGGPEQQAKADAAYRQPTTPSRAVPVPPDPRTTPAYYQSMIGNRRWVEENVEARLEQEARKDAVAAAAVGFRRRASVFGHSAPQRLENPRDPKSRAIPWTLDPFDADKKNLNVIDLEGHLPNIVPSSRICIEIPGRSVHGADLEIYTVKAVQLTARSAYGMTGNVTRLTLDRNWKTSLVPTSVPAPPAEPGFDTYDEIVQKATVHIDDVSLRLGQWRKGIINQEAIEQDGIELDGAYPGIEPGRRVILAEDPPKGEAPTDKREPESLTIAAVIHPPYPDAATPAQHQSDKPSTGRTRLHFKEPLKYQYDPNKTKVFANVVEASHGESYKQILGNGDSAREHQVFCLTRKPLTFLPTSSFPYAKPQIDVTVGQERWDYIDTLARNETGRPIFSLWIDDAASAQVIFGNGKAGARLPTGRENVVATYRVGLGQAGNVAATQLKLPVDHPVGVQSVLNTRASGGADAEPIPLVRVNTPLSTVALDRLLIEADYLPLARIFPGIAKAKVRRQSTQMGDVMLVSIVGSAAEPLTADSALCKALRSAMIANSDGFVPVYVVPGRLRPLSVGAKVTLKPGASSEDAQASIRRALLKVFSFETAELGQPVYASEALAAIQSVKDVVFARLTRFEPFDLDAPPSESRPPSINNAITCGSGGFDDDGNVVAAELILLDPHISSTITIELDTP